MHIEKRIIGRKDRVDFPELKLYNVPVKVDTGAYTSSIHCSQIKEEKINGVWTLKCRFLDASQSSYIRKDHIFTEYKEKKIKSSTGHSEKRYLIKTCISIFGENIKTEMSLSERGEMKYPVLLGRKLLNKRFIVDTQKSNLSYKHKLKSR